MNKLKNNINGNRGFTIVELLVVIVVIGILAAITIVSYTGITARANKASALSAANAVQSKAEVYYADGPTSNYPILLANLTGAASTTTYYLSPASTPLDATILSSGNLPTGPSQINFFTCGHKGTVAPPLTQGAITTITGDRIGYWDYSNATPAIAYVDNGVVAGGFVTTFEVACFITAT